MKSKDLKTASKWTSIVSAGAAMVIFQHNSFDWSRLQWCLLVGCISLLCASMLSYCFFIPAYKSYLMKKSLKFIDTYVIPHNVVQRFNKSYPQLDTAQQGMVIMGLKQYFMMHCLNVYKDESSVSYAMPTKVVDDLWHEFILDSRAYANFCEHAFERMLHHSPNDNIDSSRIKTNTSTGFCKEILQTYKASQTLKEYGLLTFMGMMPMLFALDKELRIESGFHYNLSVMHAMDEEIKKEQKLVDSSSSCSGGTSCSSSCSSGCGGGCGS